MMGEQAVSASYSFHQPAPNDAAHTSALEYLLFPNLEVREPLSWIYPKDSLSHTARGIIRVGDTVKVLKTFEKRADGSGFDRVEDGSSGFDTR